MTWCQIRKVILVIFQTNTNLINFQDVVAVGHWWQLQDAHVTLVNYLAESGKRFYIAEKLVYFGNIWLESLHETACSIRSVEHKLWLIQALSCFSCACLKSVNYILADWVGCAGQAAATEELKLEHEAEQSQQHLCNDLFLVFPLFAEIVVMTTRHITDKASFSSLANPSAWIEEVQVVLQVFVYKAAVVLYLMVPVESTQFCFVENGPNQRTNSEKSRRWSYAQ